MTIYPICDTVSSNQAQVVNDLCAKAMATWNDETTAWKPLSSTCSFKRGQVLCLEVCEDFKKIIAVRSSNARYFSFEYLYDIERGKMSGRTVMRWSELKNARIKLV